MSLTTRLMTAIILLGAGLAAQSGMLWHLNKAGPLPEVAPKRKLVEIVPMEFGDWVGQDLEISDIALYGDDHLKRAYFDKTTGEYVTLWMAYSKDGKDRGHHPDICLQVTGMAEDKRGEGSVNNLPDVHPVPIEQFLYASPNRANWIYYWHYTLKPPPDERTDEVQRLYQRTRRRFSSLTLEVFADQKSATTKDRAIAFVEAVDKMLQDDLPPGALRGSDRTPVRRIDAH